MKIPYYQIDSFSDAVFSGNPAGVCVLDDWLPEKTMQDIAAENNLSETAFVVPSDQEGHFGIRWFTPTCEVDLCGHATLAAAFVLFERQVPALSRIAFDCQSGFLSVRRKEGGWLEMNFPAWAYEEVAPERYDIGVQACAVYKADDMMFVLEGADAVRAYVPDFPKLKAVPSRCVIVTAPGDGKDDDFVSRVFCPNVGVPEDPVTGSAHCMLVPYWTNRLGVKTVMAHQISRRSGRLRCREEEGRVFLEGKASLYLEGAIFVG